MRKPTRTLTAVAASLAVAATSFGAVAQDSGDGELTLEGQRIGVAVVGTQHYWDRAAFQGVTETIEELGGEVMAVDGGRDNQVHAQNHDVLRNAGVDAVVSILGDSSVEPKLEALREADIPVFTVDHASPHSLNNVSSDNYYMGTTIGRYTARAIDEEGNVAVFNAFEGALGFCTIRAEMWKYVLEDYENINIVEPELAETFANAPEDARRKTLDLLQQYPEGELDAIHVACWDQPAIGVVEALREAGRTEIAVTALDAGPTTLDIMAEEGSPFIANVAQRPYEIGATSARNVARHFAGQELLSQNYVDVIPVYGPEEAQEVAERLGYETVN